MKIVRIVLGFLLLSAACLPAVLKPIVTSVGEYEHKVVYYVALGDSIAGGYGLKNAESESYVGRIAEALEEKYGAVRLTNFGENGLCSDELLERLTDETNENYEAYRTKIQNADLITLSIGSNDLLQYISPSMDLDEFKKNGDKILSEACRNFSENISGILQAITEYAPSARLFVNNVYNPCHDSSFQISEEILGDLEEMAEKYICEINQGFQTQKIQSVFRSTTGGNYTPKYTLVDVKTAFEESDEKLINMLFSWKNIDPHPNKEGHRIIAGLIIPQITLDK